MTTQLKPRPTGIDHPVSPGSRTSMPNTLVTERSPQTDSGVNGASPATPAFPRRIGTDHSPRRAISRTYRRPGTGTIKTLSGKRAAASAEKAVAVSVFQPRSTWALVVASHLRPSR